MVKEFFHVFGKSSNDEYFFYIKYPYTAMKVKKIHQAKYQRKYFFVAHKTERVTVSLSFFRAIKK